MNNSHETTLKEKPHELHILHLWFANKINIIYLFVLMY